MKSLFIGNASSAFVNMMAIHLAELGGHEILLADKMTGKVVAIEKADSAFLSDSRRIFRLSGIQKLLYQLKSFAKLPFQIFSIKPAIIHIHYLMPYYVLLVPLLYLFRYRLIISVYGSDLVAANNSFVRLCYIPLFKTAERVVFTNINYTHRFKQLFGEEYNNKIVVIPMGLKCIEVIDKIKSTTKQELLDRFKVPHGKNVIVCGTYAGANNNQVNILKQVLKCPSTITNSIHLIFPCTYGASETEVVNLEEQVKETGLSFTIIKNYLTYEDLARLRLIGEVLIHTPNADQFSGAMLESVYAGAYLITGTWLNYIELNTWGIHYKAINSLEDIPAALTTYFEAGKLTAGEITQNLETVKKHMTWQTSINKWAGVYNQ